MVGGITLALFRPDRPVDELKEKYAGGASRFIEIDGMPMHYRVEGRGFPLVLVHGTAASLHTWDGWVKELENDFTLVRFDLPAFGLTGPNRDHDYSIARYTLTMKKLLDALGVKKCHMAGNSLGGHIAWRFSLRYPGMVEKLVLIDAAGYHHGGSMPWVFRLARAPVLNLAARRLTPEFLFRKNLREVYGDDGKITDELVRRYYDMALRAGNRDAFIARAKASGNETFEDPRRIAVPVLIQWGEADAWIPVAQAGRFHSDIKNSKLKIYPGAGHVPMEEIPAVTAGDAKIFLKGGGRP